jgi:hypothetical protein
MTDKISISPTAAYDIVYRSDYVSDIMFDMMISMPELFKVSSFNSVKKTVVDYICNPEMIENNGLSRRFINVIKKNLPKKEKKIPDSSVSRRLANSLRAKLRSAINGGSFSEADFEMFGCDRASLISHIESQFSEGMSWGNYGFETWHIDHIQPLCSFDLTNPLEIKKATHFSNLRPLKASENLEKGRKEDKLKSINKQIKVLQA